MRRFLGVAASLLLFVAACGGSDDPSGPGGGTTLVNGTFSGTAAGGTFTPVIVDVSQDEGFVIFVAVDAQSRAIGWGVDASAPGTYTLAGGVGNNAQFYEGTSTWIAGAGFGGSGSVTFTTLTSTRAVGSYSMSLIALQGTTATGTRAIAGNFDITISP